MTHVYRLDSLTPRLWRAALACLCGALAAIWIGAPRPHHAGGAAFERGIPLLAAPEISRALGQDLPAFAATPVPGGFRMRNAGQRLTARLGRERVVVQSQAGGWIALSLRAVGHSGSLVPVASVAPRAAANVITYTHGAVREWYANGPLGLEQGFTLTRRPAGPAAGALTLLMRLSGGLRASLGPDGVTFGSGRSALHYTSPVARDASGRILRAWLELRANGLLVRVDDRHARYPVRIDPFFRQATLRASDAVHGSFGFHFGDAASASGDTIVVGAPDAGIGTGGPEGAVYVFTKPASGWADASETAKFTASDGGANDQLGTSVDFSGDTIVAGAPGAVVADHNVQGAAYVFTRSATGWVGGTETAKLTASDGAADDVLGRSVAIEGDTVIAGAQGAHIGANANQGAVYVFNKPITGWRSEGEAAKLTASDGAAQDGLGGRVALSGQTVVAAGGDAAYVFAQPAAGWSGSIHEQAKLTVPGRTLSFVAIDGITIAAGSPGQSGAAGAAEVFARPASGWSTTSTPTAQLTPSTDSANGEFGSSVAIRGARIVVGSPFETAAGTFEAGAAYVYDRPSGGWVSGTESARITEPSPGQGDQFGSGVAIVDDNALLVGAPLATSGGVQQGLAYVFTGSAPPGGGTTTTTTPPPTTMPSGPPPPIPPPPPPPFPCLSGDAKYPDFPPGIGINPDYDLSDPTTQADGTLEQTLDFGLSLFNRGLYATTGGCWSVQSHVSDNALNGYPEHEEFGTYGEVNLNGVILAPVNVRRGSVGPAELHVGTDGIIYATGDDTRYSVEIPNAGGARLTVGRVDLGASPWRWDGGLTSLIGQFDPAPDAPRPFGRPLAGGTLTAAGVGSASVTVYVQLPSLFSSTPDGGPAPTADLAYTALTNPNAPARTTGGGGGGGGGGGALNPGRCDPQTHSHCGENLAAGDASGRGVTSHAPRGRAGDAARLAGVAGAPLDLTVSEVYLGPLRLSNVFLNYDPAHDLWTGGGDAQVGGFELRAAPPPPDNGLGLHGDGSFEHGGASLSVPGGVPLFPGVDLTELGVTFALEPTRFSGDATVSAAGGLVTLHGAVLVVFANGTHAYTYQPFALPGVPRLHTDTQSNPITSTAIGVAGTVSLHLPVVGQQDLSNGYVFYIAPSYFEFAGHFALGAFGVRIDGDVAGALDTGSRRFSLAGDLEGCADFPDPVGSACIGMTGAVSSAGFGACGHVKPLVHTFAVGFRYLWSGGLTIFLDGCDLGPVQIDVRSARDPVARAASAGAFALPRGLTSASVTVSGAGGPPRVTITGPHGEHAGSDPTGREVESGRIVMLPMRDQNETLIGIERPAGGRWTITPEPGSPPITAISHANGLPPAHVEVTVLGRGRRRRLVYRVRPRAGQSVTFAERAGQVFHVLGPARGARGSLTFTAVDASTRRRQIVALISLSGVPSQTLVVGRYTAPLPPRPGAVRHLRVARRGTTLRATWFPAAHAGSYAVTVALSDGQRLALSAPRAARAVTVRAPVRGLGVRVTVQAIGSDATSGPARSGYLAPAAGPGRVRGITAIRTRAGVTVRWRAAHGAIRYLVSIVVSGAGGPAYVELSGATRLRPSTDLARLRRGRTATITVQAMNADAKLGPPGTTVYRANTHKPT